MDIVHESKWHTYYRTMEIDYQHGTVKVIVTSKEKKNGKRSFCILEKTYAVKNGTELTPEKVNRIKSWAQIDFLAAMIDGVN